MLEFGRNLGFKDLFSPTGLLCHGRLSTMDRLLMFGMDVDPQCCLCVGGMETAHHIFISCDYSQYISSRLFTQNLGISMDLNLSWNQFLLQLLNIQQKEKKVIALLVAQSFVYQLWRERNSRMHNGELSHPNKILQIILADVRTRLNGFRWFNVRLFPEYSIWLS